MKVSPYLWALVALFLLAPARSGAAVINEVDIPDAFPQGEVVLGSIFVTNYGQGLMGVSYTTAQYATLYPLFREEDGFVDISFSLDWASILGRDISIPLPKKPFAFVVKTVGGGGFYWDNVWVPDGKAVIDNWKFDGWANLAPAVNSSVVINAVAVPEPAALALFAGIPLLGFGLWMRRKR